MIRMKRVDHLKILHISDLHYSHVKQREIEYIRDAILHDVDSFLKINNLIPDLVIFSGDLLFKPDENKKSIEEFEKAYKFFIKPLLEKLELSNDHIFITPGNHDINRTTLTRKDIKGLSSYAMDKHLVNELIDEIINEKTDIPHMSQFNKFITSLENHNELYSNEIFRIYKIAIGKISIGIANINSTLLSFDDGTYGNLIIGEEQLRKAHSYIEECDIKIANVHHSVNWLIWFEQQLVKKFYYRHFNLVFIGHEHMEQPELVNFNDEDTLIINSASIYQGRNNINGYSLLNYSFSDNSADIYIREYDDRETKFSTVTFRNVDNKYTYNFNIFGKSKNKKNIELILDEIQVPLKSLIQNELLINTAKNENYLIEDIFVQPNIHTKSEFTESTEDNEEYTINKILYSKKPIIIKGIESSGKTTLLNYIANEYLNIKSQELKIPIIINFSDLKGPLNDTMLVAKTIEYFRKLNKDISHKELERLSRDGDLVFLIDNFITTDENRQRLEEIFQNDRFKKNQYILTSKEEIFNSLQNLKETNQKNEFHDITILYLYNLKREKAREFFSLYFKGNNFENHEFEDIFKFISKLNIPLTIFNYTLIAHVYENQKNNFKPLNEAYLLDIFMENLLEKLDVSKNAYIGSLGYNLKSSYLIFIAKWMVQECIFIVDKYKLQELTSKFIQELKREKEGINVELLIDYMEQKGIFVNIGSNQYRFRYRAFLEFFIAKGMEKDETLKKYIIDEGNYLNYLNEIRFYSGLHGEDDHLIEHFNNVMLKEKDYFERIQNNDSSAIYVPNVRKNIEKISIDQISESHRDKNLEITPSHIQANNTTKTVSKLDTDFKQDQELLDKKIFQTNILLSNIIRNSEQLRNPDLKIKTLNVVINNFSKLFQDNLNKSNDLKKKLHDLIKSEEYLQKIEDNDVNEFISMLNIVIAQAFMYVVNNNLASDSFYTIFDEIITESQDDIVKLLIVSTLIYSDNYKSFELLQRVVEDENFSKNRYLMMSLFFRIYNSVKNKEVADRYKKQYEEMLTDIILKIKANEISYSGSQKKQIIEQNKKTISDQIQKSMKD